MINIKPVGENEKGKMKGGSQNVAFVKTNLSSVAQNSSVVYFLIVVSIRKQSIAVAVLDKGSSSSISICFLPSFLLLSKARYVACTDRTGVHVCYLRMGSLSLSLSLSLSPSAVGN